MKWSNSGVLLVFLCLFLGAIVLSDRGEPKISTSHGSSAQAPDSQPKNSNTSGRSSNTRDIRASDVTWKWPLVALEATISCSGSPRGPNVVTAEIGGKEFALNGTARAAGFPELGAHWVDDESNPGAKIDISPLTDFALSLCGENRADAQIRVSSERHAMDAAEVDLERWVRSQLKDPDSAQFRNVSFDPKKKSGCGEVNAKNGFGGYTGYHHFWVQLKEPEQPAIWIDSGNSELAKAVCSAK